MTTFAILKLFVHPKESSIALTVCCFRVYACSEQVRYQSFGRNSTGTDFLATYVKIYASFFIVELQLLQCHDKFAFRMLMCESCWLTHVTTRNSQVSNCSVACYLFIECLLLSS